MFGVRVPIYMLCSESVLCPVRIPLVLHVSFHVWCWVRCIIPKPVSPNVILHTRTRSYVLLSVSLTSNRIYCGTAGKPLVECRKILTSSLHDSALVLYEYLLTVPAEVRLVWRKRWRGLTVLFILNRYTMIASAIFLVAPYTNKVCLQHLCTAVYHWRMSIVLLVVSIQPRLGKVIFNVLD